MRSRVLLIALMVAVAAGHVLAAPAAARVNVNVGLVLPGPIIIAQPALAVVPGAPVYYAPQVSFDLYFYHGYWYRPYRGGWYWSGGYGGPWRHMGYNPFAAYGYGRGWGHHGQGHRGGGGGGCN